MTNARVDRSLPEPLWSQVLTDLRQRLAAGEFAAGLPAERELQGHYGVSRHTMRDALRRLHDAGAIERTRGRGSFPMPPIEQRTGALYSLFRAIEAQGMVQDNTVLSLRIVTDAAAACALGLPAGVELVELRRVRRADGEPIAIDEVWLPAAIARPLLDADFERTAVYDELAARCGVRPGAGWERIRPAVAEDEQAAALDVPAGSALFLVERFSSLDDGPLEWRRTLIRGDRFAFLSSWTATGEQAAPPSFSTRPARAAR